jgi:predicted protein tyrosine phosphatase
LHAGINVASAGTNDRSDKPLTSELITWADLILVMEQSQAKRIRQKFKALHQGKRLICLDIPDKFGYMDERLIELLRARVTPFLPV